MSGPKIISMFNLQDEGIEVRFKDQGRIYDALVKPDGTVEAYVFDIETETIIQSREGTP